MMKRADKTALEDRKETLNGIGCNVATSIFPDTVINRFVTGKVLANLFVRFPLIGHEVGILSDIRLKDGLEGFAGDIGNVERAHLAAALNQGNNLHLVARAARVLAIRLFVAPIRFIRFDYPAIAAKLAFVLSGHGFAESVGHKPRGLVSNPQNTMKLMGAHSLFGRADQESGQKPLMKGNLGALENGANSNAKVRTASFLGAAVNALALGCVGVINRAAMRANRPIRPKGLFEVFTGRFVIVEAFFIKLAHSNLQRVKASYPLGIVVSSI